MKLVKYTDGEWAALYVDGKLDVAGDCYLADDRIAELADVEIHSSDAFLRGGNTYEGIASTLDELHEWEREQETKNEEADRLRAEAAELIARANELAARANGN